MILRKGFKVKEASKEGVVVACFATMGVIDKDGDITLPGFFGKQDVVMLPAHDWKHVPIGKGTVRESGDQAIAELKMNLAIPAAADWHKALLFDLENGPALQEYSYGFTIRDGGSSPGGEDAQKNKAARTLRPTPEGEPGCIIHEVSPVLVGAGARTGTLAAKGDGQRFIDEAAAALEAVEGLVGRAGALAALRGKDGRGMSAANTEKLKQLAARLEAAKAALSPLLTEDESRRALRAELGRSLFAEGGLT